jgi:hypothetical protein
MAGYTKSDYDSLYSIRVRLPNGRRSPIRLHYHRYAMQDIVREHWDYLVSELKINESDRVLVIGAGFGWGIERLVELTGCWAIGTDISSHVQGCKKIAETNELRQCVRDSGYDPDSGEGLEVMEACDLPLVRCMHPILDEDMCSYESRDNVYNALDDLPTLLVTEDILSDFSDEDAKAFCAELDKVGCRVCHVVRTTNHTAEEWHKITGQTIVTCGDHRRVG